MQSQPFGVPFEQWRLVNAMLPREYYPALQVRVCAYIYMCVYTRVYVYVGELERRGGAEVVCVCDMYGTPITQATHPPHAHNKTPTQRKSRQHNVLERRALSVARQLLGEDMALDYDQLLQKQPSKYVFFLGVGGGIVVVVVLVWLVGTGGEGILVNVRFNKNSLRLGLQGRRPERRGLRVAPGPGLLVRKNTPTYMPGSLFFLRRSTHPPTKTTTHNPIHNQAAGEPGGLPHRHHLPRAQRRRHGERLPPRRAGLAHGADAAVPPAPDPVAGGRVVCVCCVVLVVLSLTRWPHFGMHRSHEQTPTP